MPGKSLKLPTYWLYAYLGSILFCVATNNGVIDMFCFAAKSQHISGWPLLCCLLQQFCSILEYISFLNIWPISEYKIWTIKVMNNSWAKHVVDTISTSGTVQVFFYVIILLCLSYFVFFIIYFGKHGYFVTIPHLTISEVCCIVPFEDGNSSYVKTGCQTG